MQNRKRRSFTAEQKAHAVELVKRIGNVSQVARDLGVSASVLHRWLRQSEIDAGEGPEGAVTTAEREDMRRLRRENQTLRLERDFLKKAAAFFAKETSRLSS
jgi:transposase